MKQVTTNLARLVEHDCDTRLERWLSAELERLGRSDCAPVAVSVLLSAEADGLPGLDWALWALRVAEPRVRAEVAAREIAVACAERVLHMIRPYNETYAHLAVRAARESIGSGPTPELSRLRDAMWAEAVDMARRMGSRTGAVNARLSVVQACLSSPTIGVSPAAFAARLAQPLYLAELRWQVSRAKSVLCAA